MHTLVASKSLVAAVTAAAVLVAATSGFLRAEGGLAGLKKDACHEVEVTLWAWGGPGEMPVRGS